MPDNARDDFELSKYGYDREHELELNRFTHALEMEQLKLLILLNGGAATALLAFADGAGLGDRLSSLLVPVLFWLSGLGVGAWATFTMRTAQSGYAQFYRLRRSAIEWRQLSPDRDRERLAQQLGLPPMHILRQIYGAEAEQRRQDASGAELNDRAAAFVVGKAHRANGRIYPISLASLALFLLGALGTAYIVVGKAPTVSSPAPNVAVSR